MHNKQEQQFIKSINLAKHTEHSSFPQPTDSAPCSILVASRPISIQKVT